MDNSSSSNNSNFYDPRYHIFSRNQSYEETIPTELSQNERNFDSHFQPTYQPAFDQNTGLDTVGYGAYGPPFDQYQIPPPQGYYPVTNNGVQTAYGDVRNRPSSNLYADPWTPTPFNNHDYGYTSIHDGRPSASGTFPAVSPRT